LVTRTNIEDIIAKKLKEQKKLKSEKKRKVADTGKKNMRRMILLKDSYTDVCMVSRGK
jgi:hypothetical protein